MTDQTAPTTTERLGAPIATLRVPRGMSVTEFLDLMDSDYAKALELSRKATEAAITNMIAQAS